jgi:hypothetical protein
MQNLWLFKNHFPQGQKVIVDWPDSNIDQRKGTVNVVFVNENKIVIEIMIWHQVYGSVYYSVLPKFLRRI